MYTPVKGAKDEGLSTGAGGGTGKLLLLFDLGIVKLLQLLRATHIYHGATFNTLVASFVKSHSIDYACILSEITLP